MNKDINNYKENINSYSLTMNHKALLEKDEIIKELRNDMNAIRKVYETKLSLANKEIEMLKQNLCAVKRVCNNDKKVSELQKENELLRNENRKLNMERENYAKNFYR